MLKILTLVLFLLPVFSGFCETAGLQLKKNPLILSETSENLVSRDADGKRVTVKKHPKRVVICYVSLIGLWYCAGGEVVAIPWTMNMDCVPPRARKLPQIGRFSCPNPEKLLQLKPDLVLLVNRVGKHHDIRELVNQCGIDSLLLSYENYGDFINLLDLFMRLNGKSPQAAEAGRIIEEVEQIRKKYAGRKGPRFLVMQMSSRGFNADTNRAHTAYMATALGGRNVITDKIAGPKGKRVKVNLERVVMENPDMIFVSSPSRLDKVEKKLRKEFRTNPAWKGLKAVKTGNVYFLPHDLFMYRPNERFPEAFRILAEIMYPRNNTTAKIMEKRKKKNDTSM